MSLLGLAPQPLFGPLTYAPSITMRIWGLGMASMGPAGGSWSQEGRAGWLGCWFLDRTLPEPEVQGQSARNLWTPGLKGAEARCVLRTALCRQNREWQICKRSAGRERWPPASRLWAVPPRSNSLLPPSSPRQRRGSVTQQKALAYHVHIPLNWA